MARTPSCAPRSRATSGFTSTAALIEAVHSGQVPDSRCAELTPLLFTVAEAGDPVAADVVRRQAEEVVSLAVAAARRLGVVDEPIDVVLGGGVLTAGHRLLMDGDPRPAGP